MSLDGADHARLRRVDAAVTALLDMAYRRVGGGEISRIEMINLGPAPLTAGYETTAHQPSLAILELLTGDAPGGAFPGLRLAPRDGALVWREGLATRGVSRLLVEW
ncbi:hypothetical protein [Streptomyces sp. NPDC006658]|uniref:hypothetical protein n=1 Tax=Streptomyces sp. NPDC006658 TaxID=3156900 RepID=UPI0033CE6B94